MKPSKYPRISLRVTDKTLQRWEREAKGRHLNLSQFIRNVVNRSCKVKAERMRFYQKGGK